MMALSSYAAGIVKSWLLKNLTDKPTLTTSEICAAFRSDHIDDLTDGVLRCGMSTVRRALVFWHDRGLIHWEKTTHKQNGRLKFCRCWALGAGDVPRTVLSPEYIAYCKTKLLSARLADFTTLENIRRVVSISSLTALKSALAELIAEKRFEAFNVVLSSKRTLHIYRSLTVKEAKQ